MSSLQSGKGKHKVELKDHSQSESVFNVDTAEDLNIKREIFDVIDMNRASLLTGFKQEDLIIIIKVETMLLVEVNVSFSMGMW